MPSESLKRNEIAVNTKIYLSLLGLTTLSAINGAMVVGRFVDKEVNLSKLDLDKPVEVKSLDRKYIKLEQEGKTITLQIDKLPDTVQKKLAEQFPNLKDFLGNGPINIVDVEKGK